jgi:hypothetical protein
MTDEIKVGQKWRHNRENTVIEIRFIDDNGYVMAKWPDGKSWSVQSDLLRTNHTLIPDTVTLSVELTRDELDHVSRCEPLGAPSSNYAHAKNKFIEAARALKETL